MTTSADGTVRTALSHGLRLITRHYPISAVGLGLTLFIQLADTFPFYVWLGVIVGIYQTMYAFTLPKLYDLAEHSSLTANDIFGIPIRILRRIWIQGLVLFGVTMVSIAAYVSWATSTGNFLSNIAILLIIIGISACAACLTYASVFVSLFEQSLLSSIRLSIRFALRHKPLTVLLFLFAVATLSLATFPITSPTWLILQQLFIQLIAYILITISYSYITADIKTPKQPGQPDVPLAH